VFKLKKGENCSIKSQKNKAIMARNATNKLLQQAKKSKSDEFYTQLSDIESELQHYKNHFKDQYPRHQLKLIAPIKGIFSSVY
jgi:Adenine-specific methyltransferase EcoRI